MHLIDFENEHLKGKDLVFIEETGILAMHSNNDIGKERRSFSVVENDEIVAFVKFEYLLNNYGKVKIILLETVEKGKGIGSKVLDYLKIIFAKMGLDMIYFNPNNDAVANFLQKNRFKESKRGYYHIIEKY